MKSIASFIIVAILLCCAMAVFGAQQDAYVRVAIMRDQSSFDLTVAGPYQVIDQNTGRMRYQGKSLKSKVIMSSDAVFISSINTKGQRLIIKPQKPESIRVNNRRFRGDIVLVYKKSGVLVINYLAIDDYLKGVLYHEISHYWPMEAIKAQAVVSRTYAYSQMQANRGKEYDLSSDIFSQVYGGRTSERWRTNRAVDQTKGIFLLYQSKVFPAYFHATCGGATEDASNLWKINLEPLRGVVCDYCKRSPHFTWRYSMAMSDFIAALNKAGFAIDSIADIAVTEKTQSGRAKTLSLTDANGRTLAISAKDLRNAIGPNQLRSTIFTVKATSEAIDFYGIGWGHGVGMCQWGAYFLAKQGKRYETILQFYYPGTTVGYVN